jgi:hypothetical protein
MLSNGRHRNRVILRLTYDTYDFVASERPQQLSHTKVESKRKHSADQRAAYVIEENDKLGRVLAEGLRNYAGRLVSPESERKEGEQRAQYINSLLTNIYFLWYVPETGKSSLGFQYRLKSRHNFKCLANPRS